MVCWTSFFNRAKGWTFSYSSELDLFASRHLQETSALFSLGLACSCFRHNQQNPKLRLTLP
jgi:hypothetical protein